MVRWKFGGDINKGFLAILAILAILALQIKVFFKIDCIPMGGLFFDERG